MTEPHALLQGQGLTKKREDQRKKDCVPTNTLFVVNFDPGTTRERDLEKHFSQYGKLTRVQVKKNFGFVAFESLDDAIDARVACGNGVRFQGTCSSKSAWPAQLYRDPISTCALLAFAVSTGCLSCQTCNNAGSSNTYEAATACPYACHFTPWWWFPGRP